MLPTIQLYPFIFNYFMAAKKQSFNSKRTFFFLIIDYAITVVLIFPLLPPSTHQPPHPQAIPPYFSSPWVLCISSLATPCLMLYFTFPCLFCNYILVLLNPLTSPSTPPYHPSTRQPSNHSPYP